MQRAGRRRDGTWYLGRGVGRGVWWCRDGSCVARLESRTLSRALRVALTAADVDNLVVLVRDAAGSTGPGL